ncbi:MAG: XAC2610-related protein [Flavobacteriales bacterium]
MKLITFILIFILSKFALCQTTFVVDNFSKEYFGKLYIADTTEVFSKGWVAIFDKRTKKQLIKINSDELTFELHKGKVLANIKELPYGEQSQILYEDYNFDGIKDFAIMDGQNSCYHGPSFQIYLATDKGFKQSPEFTELSQDYCGMFDIDHKTKTIRTMTKSGCCWHQYSEFKVKGSKPYPIKIVEEGMSASGITWDYEEQNLVNGKMIKSTYQMLALEVDKDNLLLSFEFENKKKMQIFRTENILYYIFTDSNDKIELLYNDIFKYSNRESTLSFTNRNTEYIIYEEKIIVKTPNHTYDMKAVSNTRFGTLTKLKNLKLENVIN